MHLPRIQPYRGRQFGGLEDRSRNNVRPHRHGGRWTCWNSLAAGRGVPLIPITLIIRPPRTAPPTRRRPARPRPSRRGRRRPGRPSPGAPHAHAGRAGRRAGARGPSRGRPRRRCHLPHARRCHGRRHHPRPPGRRPPTGRPPPLQEAPRRCGAAARPPRGSPQRSRPQSPPAVWSSPVPMDQPPSICASPRRSAAGGTTDHQVGGSWTLVPTVPAGPGRVPVGGLTPTPGMASDSASARRSRPPVGAPGRAGRRFWSVGVLRAGVAPFGGLCGDSGGSTPCCRNQSAAARAESAAPR